MLSFEAQGKLRSPESLSPPLTIAFFSPFLTLETTLTGPPCDVTYDRTHFPPQVDEARTVAIFTGIRPRFLQKLLEQKSKKILVNSTQPKVQEQPIKMKINFCMKAPPLIFVTTLNCRKTAWVENYD